MTTRMTSDSTVAATIANAMTPFCARGLFGMRRIFIDHEASGAPAIDGYGSAIQVVFRLTFAHFQSFAHLE